MPFSHALPLQPRRGQPTPLANQWKHPSSVHRARIVHTRSTPQTLPITLELPPAFGRAWPAGRTGSLDTDNCPSSSHAAGGWTKVQPLGLFLSSRRANRMQEGRSNNNN